MDLRSLDMEFRVYLTRKGHLWQWQGTQYWSHLPFYRSCTSTFYGHECAICLQPCWTLRSTWKTSCHHVFHKSCLRRWIVNTKWQGTCPYCRQDMGCLEFVEGQRYRIIGRESSSPFYFSDMTEELDSLVPRLCPTSLKDDDSTRHFQGMSPTCLTCHAYRHVVL